MILMKTKLTLKMKLTVKVTMKESDLYLRMLPHSNAQLVMIKKMIHNPRELSAKILKR